LHVHETESTLAGWQYVQIQTASNVTIDPKTSTTRGTGLTLAILGAAALVVGSVLVINNNTIGADMTSVP
jgi:hypothetical protein